MADYDVLVVGAGPAGATAARTLAELGVSILVIDKADFPREKPCGGGISARALTRFPYLAGVFERVATHAVRKVYLESPGGHGVTYEAAEPVYHLVRRCEFDAALFALAEPGVAAEQGSMVRGFRAGADRAEVDVADGRTFTAKLVIAADSANSYLARAAGLRSGTVRGQYAIDMMEETRYERLRVKDTDAIYVYYGLARHFGYGYVFPKAEHINLGFGCKLDYYLETLRGKGQQHHHEFVADVKARGVVDGESDPSTFRAFPIPISGPLKRTYANRVLLCGDAGGFVNAFTAEGIYYAMVSGELAARAAAEALRNDRFDARALAHYEQLWQAEFGEELSESVRIQQRLLGDPARIDRVVRAAQRDPKLLELLARYATGMLSYEELKRYLVRSALPLYLWEKARAALT